MEWIWIVGPVACGLGMLAMMAVMGWMMGKGMQHGSEKPAPRSREERETPDSSLTTSG